MIHQHKKAALFLLSFCWLNLVTQEGEMKTDKPKHDVKEEAKDLGRTSKNLGAVEEGDAELQKLTPPMADGTEGEDILGDPREHLTPG
jgi:hypothetical protein